MQNLVSTLEVCLRRAEGLLCARHRVFRGVWAISQESHSFVQDMQSQGIHLDTSTRLRLQKTKATCVKQKNEIHFTNSTKTYQERNSARYNRLSAFLLA
jgi:hypothetical protein